MEVGAVVDRIISDNDYAKEMLRKYIKVLETTDGDIARFANNPAWKTFLSEFADSPEELAQIVKTDIASTNGSTWWLTTGATVTCTTLTPAGGALTVTTMTTMTTAAQAKKQ
jgi:hypothetical protein